MAGNFPDPLEHDFPEWVLCDDYYYYAKDIISFGDELSVANLREAYGKGIFPWHIPGIPLPWYCPEQRSILEFDDLHVPRSLRRARNTSEYNYTIDREFEQVIHACSVSTRKGQSGTWITKGFIDAFTELHKAGMAHSVEVWNTQDELVGGLYGVDAGGVFCGESMFYRERNASKLALLFLIDHLHSKGSTWFDNQVMTPHLQALGAKEITRDSFLKKLKEAQAMKIRLFN